SVTVALLGSDLQPVVAGIRYVRAEFDSSQRRKWNDSGGCSRRGEQLLIQVQERGKVSTLGAHIICSQDYVAGQQVLNAQVPLVQLWHLRVCIDGANSHLRTIH